MSIETQKAPSLCRYRLRCSRMQTAYDNATAKSKSQLKMSLLERTEGRAANSCGHISLPAHSRAIKLAQGSRKA
eukprot:1922713-Karenia_brevis.AAC.1